MFRRFKSFKLYFFLCSLSLFISGCGALSALSALSGSSSNSGTQVKAHAEIGDNKRQQQVSLGNSTRSDNNKGRINGKEYTAKSLNIHNDNGLSWKEISLMIGMVALVFIALRVPWGFWRKKKNLVQKT